MGHLGPMAISLAESRVAAADLALHIATWGHPEVAE